MGHPRTYQLQGSNCCHWTVYRDRTLKHNVFGICTYFNDIKDTRQAVWGLKMQLSAGTFCNNSCKATEVESAGVHHCSAILELRPLYSLMPTMISTSYLDSAGCSHQLYPLLTSSHRAFCPLVHSVTQHRISAGRPFHFGVSVKDYKVFFFLIWLAWSVNIWNAAPLNLSSVYLPAVTK